MFTESFYSTSVEGAIRGMHLQMPPADGAKLVYVLSGSVIDVALDLRVGSPAFGKAVRFSLSPERPMAAYLPRGVAHGFVAISGPATLIYNVSSEYDPQLDTGVRWDSFGFDWGVQAPLLSTRDRGLRPFSDFESPFCFSLKEASA
jgi:dTDP-4-dehydrorhamnose 3,5-epimerase